MFGDVVIRWMSGDYDGPALPNYEELLPAVNNSYGLERIDHVVSNVPNLFEAVDYLMQAIGLHEFSEFTAEDVGTVDSGLNSMVSTQSRPYLDTNQSISIQTYIHTYIFMFPV
jgi:4-hydroxyphenylpyruvate dioxygenase